MDGAGRTAPDTPRKPEIATQLCAFTLFQGLSIHDLEQVAEVIESLTVEAGAFVVRQGEDSEDLFLIVAGTADVYERDSFGRSCAVAQMLAGDFFGEIGLLNAQPRTADVRARTQMSLLRLSRSAYLAFIVERADIHARVAASAARRAGATIDRMASPGAAGDSHAPFEMLLRRLLDRDIDSMRAAEVRGDPITFEDVVSFYRATGFLYPAKLGVLESRFDAVRTTWQRLIPANNDVFKMLMLRRVVDGQLVAKNSICAFEYASGVWQIQHLVSADRHEFTGTLAALLGVSDWIQSRADIRAIRLSYRPTNRGTNRLFHELAQALPRERSLESLCNYYVAPLGPTVDFAPTDGIVVRPARASDLQVLSRLYVDEHPELPVWLDLEDLTARTLDAKYAAHRLERSRLVLVAERAGKICGSVVCWWASEGVNFSFLENAIADLAVDRSLETTGRATIARALLGAAVSEYQSRDRRYVIALINKDLEELVAASGVLPDAVKQYGILTFDTADYVAVRSHFERYYTAMLLERGLVSTSTAHRKGDARG